MTEIDHRLINKIMSCKDELSQNFFVESLSIFGSVSRGTAGPDSDIDILVRFKKTPGLFGFIDLKCYLEEILERPTDLVTEHAIKKQMRDDILREAVRVS